MIKRTMASTLLQLAKKYPCITITGPRQSGKTTLCKMVFPKSFYCSLEDLDTKEHAEHDPRDFLKQAKKMIIDEVHKVPSLISYIQGIVDREKRSGQFILTGSHNFELTYSISQSLAGRTALLKLLPLSIKELKKNNLTWSQFIYQGFYPGIISKKLNPTQAYSFYTHTYIQKDLRDIKEIKNLRQFEMFLKICASHVGQIINKAEFSNSIGVDSKTIDNWLSILQAGYIIFLLHPHSNNLKKRIVRRPKLYFYDVGLASYLLGIKKQEHIISHPLKGALFENLVLMEKVKQKLNKAMDPDFYYFRDKTGHEVDLIEDTGDGVISYEIKTTSTLRNVLFKGLDFYKKLNQKNKKSVLIYTGKNQCNRYGHIVRSYTDYF